MSSVKVPTLLYHDVDGHVLVMSDLGSLPNLSEVFSDLGGYSPAIVPPELKRHSQSDIITDSPMFFDTIGTRFGSFFARLRSPKSLLALLDDKERGSDFLTNPEIGNFASNRASSQSKHD